MMIDKCAWPDKSSGAFAFVLIFLLRFLHQGKKRKTNYSSRGKHCRIALQKAQVCDATDDDSSNGAQYKVFSYFLMHRILSFFGFEINQLYCFCFFAE